MYTLTLRKIMFQIYVFVNVQIWTKHVATYVNNTPRVLKTCCFEAYKSSVIIIQFTETQQGDTLEEKYSYRISILTCYLLINTQWVFCVKNVRIVCNISTISINSVYTICVFFLCFFTLFHNAKELITG